YDPNGNRLFADCCGRQQPALQGKLGATGTYTIRVQDYGFDELMSYRVFFERIVPHSPGATEITSGQNLTGEINPVGEADQYFFTASANDTVNMRAFSTAFPTRRPSDLYDPNGNRLFADCC